jgi:hypothetical protein
VNEERRQARWNILLAVYRPGSNGLSQIVIEGVLKRTHYRATTAEIQDLLREMAERGLVKIEELVTGSLHTTITPYGRDIVEYAPGVECPAAIARPPEPPPF